MSSSNMSVVPDWNRLAYVEIYLILAALIRRFEIVPKLNQRTEDILIWADRSLPVLTSERLYAFIKVRDD
jgi:hypothetical protein